jgi:hypothetical protein
MVMFTKGNHTLGRCSLNGIMVVKGIITSDVTAGCFCCFFFTWAYCFGDYHFQIRNGPVAKILQNPTAV